MSQPQKIVGLLNNIVFVAGLTAPPTVSGLLDSVHPVLESCHSVMERLAALIPPAQFWRWKDMWSNSMKTAVFAAVLVEYLTSRKLLTIAEVSKKLGSELMIR